MGGLRYVHVAWTLIIVTEGSQSSNLTEHLSGGQFHMSGHVFVNITVQAGNIHKYLFHGPYVPALVVVVVFIGIGIGIGGKVR